MLYCPNCQVVSTDDSTCPSCGSKKLRNPEPDDPVLLLTADEAKTERIEAAFEEHQIPYEARIYGLGGPPSVILGRQMSTNNNIFVPFGQLNNCQELLNGIGIINPEDEAFLKEEKQPKQEEPGEEEPPQMSRGKRFFWRAFSIILFILVVWGVVSAADYAAAALKALLSGS